MGRIDLQLLENKTGKQSHDIAWAVRILIENNNRVSLL